MAVPITCDLKVESFDGYPDRYLLVIRNPYNTFKVRLSQYDTSVEEWQAFLSALKRAERKKVIQTNLILESDTRKDLRIYVSNNDQNVVCETSIPAHLAVQPLSMMITLLQAEEHNN